jgi:hypothetical protein
MFVSVTATPVESPLIGVLAISLFLILTDAPQRFDF